MRPFELHDLLPSDLRFKILVFAGDTTDPEQRKRVQKVADAMTAADGFLGKTGKAKKVVDIMAVSSGDKDRVNYNELPAVFRSHWSK